MSLQTDSQSVAEKKVLPVILEWKKQIDLAKGLDIGSDDELLATIMRVRQDTQRAKAMGLNVVERQMAQEEIAMSEALGLDNKYSGSKTLLDAVSVALKESVKWYRLAAEQGDASSQRNLGVAAQLGGGVLQDDVMAHMWFNIASANGDPIAGELRDKRAGLMSPADISKAQAMARECMSSGYTKCGY